MLLDRFTLFGFNNLSHPPPLRWMERISRSMISRLPLVSAVKVYLYSLDAPTVGTSNEYRYILQQIREVLLLFLFITLRGGGGVEKSCYIFAIILKRKRGNAIP